LTTEHKKITKVYSIVPQKRIDLMLKQEQSEVLPRGGAPQNSATSARNLTPGNSRERAIK